MKYKIPIIARIDTHERNSVRIYNNEQELIQDHPKATAMRIGSDGKYQRVPVSLTDDQIRDILNEDDPQENGHVRRSTIEIEIVDGIPKLAERITI